MFGYVAYKKKELGRKRKLSSFVSLETNLLSLLNLV